MKYKFSENAKRQMVATLQRRKAAERPAPNTDSTGDVEVLS